MKRKQTTPPIQEPDNPHHKKRGGKKPFIIESRYVGTALPESWAKRMRDWYVYGRYRTEKDRQQALDALQSKEESNKNTFLRGSDWEYRAVE